MKKSELQQIIREEIQKEIFSLFQKKTPPPPPSKPTVTQPKPNLQSTEPTVEGISAKGTGYTVWKGPKENAIGDMRQKSNSVFENTFGTIEKNGAKFRYYFVVKNLNGDPLKDHVDRRAYFTVSTPNDNISNDKLKETAEAILNMNKGLRGITNW